VVEGRVARLDHEAVAVAWRDRLDELGRAPFLDCRPHEAGGVAVPDAVVVVGVDDRKLGAACFVDRGDEGWVAPAEGLEQRVGPVVAEVLDHVDEQECVLHGRAR
jgi:hypothetical protein